MLSVSLVASITLMFLVELSDSENYAIMIVETVIFMISNITIAVELACVDLSS